MQNTVVSADTLANARRETAHATRALHVYTGNLWGGVEAFLATLARTPGSESHAFALCDEGRLADELRAAGKPPVMFGPARLSRPSQVLRARRRLAELVRAGGYEIVICHSPWTQALFGGVVRGASLPLAFFLHDAVEGNHWLERLAKRTPPDVTVCNSAFTAATVDKLYPGGARAVVHCAVDVDRGPRDVDATGRVRLRASLGAADDDVVLLQVSRMEPWKGHQQLLEALARLKQRGRWRLWLVGGAQRRSERAYVRGLEAFVRHLGLSDRVRFLGQRSDVPELLRAADVFVQVNRDPEPFGIAFVEALAAGLPVIGAHAGGVTEIVTTECGRLVEARPGAIAAAIAELVDDARTRQALGARGPARARAVSDPRRQLERLDDVLGSAKRHREARS